MTPRRTSNSLSKLPGLSLSEEREKHYYPSPGTDVLPNFRIFRGPKALKDLNFFFLENEVSAESSIVRDSKMSKYLFVGRVDSCF